MRSDEDVKGHGLEKGSQASWLMNHVMRGLIVRLAPDRAFDLLRTPKLITRATIPPMMEARFAVHFKTTCAKVPGTRSQDQGENRK